MTYAIAVLNFLRKKKFLSVYSFQQTFNNKLIIDNE